MSIVVELEPEFEERLRKQAAELGVPVQKYVEDLLRREAVESPAGQPSLAEFEADWAGFPEGLDHIPPLPSEALSREAIYGERD